MASIELYINKQLCDIDNPNNFSVYLKRQLINPAELSTKDAQRSYDITLPASPTNNHIFGHINTEEVKAKFLQVYDAQLYVDGEKIFDGKFRMSEIGKDHYKGNLGIPAAKAIKDIFGEKKMNEINGTWNIEFKGPESITKYNKEENPDCFFPLVLYKLLSKNRLGENLPDNERYSPKDQIDNTVNLNREDFPPSINCLKTIKKIFENSGLKISGSAFDDERLSKLYMSYKNPKDYDAPWVTGVKPYVYFWGLWTNIKDIDDENTIETRYSAYGQRHSVDLLNCDNLKPGDHNTNNISSNMRDIVIPAAGLYKIELRTTSNWRIRGHQKQIIPSSAIENNFNDRRFEIKAIRCRDGERPDLKKLRFDNIFHKNNIDQTPNSTVRYYPDKNGVNLIDPAINEDLLCGLSFGNLANTSDYNPLKGKPVNNPIVIKSGKSWTEQDCKESWSATKTQYCKFENGIGKESPKHAINLANITEREGIKTGISYKKEDEKNPFDKIVGFADGYVCQVVWLEKGERITVVTLSDTGWTGEIRDRNPGWIDQQIAFELIVKGFRHDKEWLKLTEDGWGSGEIMSWNDTNNFHLRDMDLLKFLPSNVSINNWLENFSKAFNLDLKQVKDKHFELNLKSKNYSNTTIIDLNKKTDVNIVRLNIPLNLPKSYNIGFKIDDKEHGYMQKEDRGNDIINTQSSNDKELKIESEFSYNWNKSLWDSVNDKIIPTPVITENHIWRNKIADYENVKDEVFTDLAQRFWYKANDTDKIHLLPVKIEGKNVSVAEASNTLDSNKKMILNYKNEPNSILNSYFIRFADADNCYTSIECFLSPEEYNNIDSSLALFNGDLYYIAEVDGYDPQCNQKTKIKLIRKQK